MERFLDGRTLRSKDYPHVKRLRNSIPVAKIARVVAEEYGVSPDEILKARSLWGEARQAMVEVSYRLNITKKSLQELGQELGSIGGDAVGHAHERFQRKIENDKRVTQRIERILQKLSQ
jgi:chromosomal replication initiation ATPase DnaA